MADCHRRQPLKVPAGVTMVPSFAVQEANEFPQESPVRLNRHPRSSGQPNRKTDCQCPRPVALACKSMPKPPKYRTKTGSSNSPVSCHVARPAGVQRMVRVTDCVVANTHSLLDWSGNQDDPGVRADPSVAARANAKIAHAHRNLPKHQRFTFLSPLRCVNRSDLDISYRLNHFSIALIDTANKPIHPQWVRRKGQFGSEGGQ
jgi:hypothetical protein